MPRRWRPSSPSRPTSPLVLQPPPSVDLHALFTCRQTLCVVMRASHPLAQEGGPVRLRECLTHPLALPDRSLAIRHHLDDALARRGTPFRPAVESSSLEFLRNLALREDVVSLQVPSGIPNDQRLVSRPIDERDLSPMTPDSRPAAWADAARRRREIRRRPRREPQRPLRRGVTCSGDIPVRSIHSTDLRYGRPGPIPPHSCGIHPSDVSG